MAATAPPTPSAVAGHYVRRPTLVSVGLNRRQLVYAVSPWMLASIELSDDVAHILPTVPPSGSGGRVTGVYASVANPSEESISFLCVHPEKDMLCVGTEAHGVYVTSASRPILSSETRLPLDISGERTYSGCFLHVPAAVVSKPAAGYSAPLKRNAPPAAPPSALPARPAPAAEEDVLVFSSTFREKKGPSPHRLSLYAVRERCLLWRGAMEPLDSIGSFTREWAFAACTAGRVSLFNVQWTPTTRPGSRDESSLGSGQRASNRSQNSKATLLSRLCSTVDELHDAEYVCCATGTSGGATAATGALVALTANGFVVAFDKETGAVVRWMDCKVCPAHAVHVAGPNLLVVGSMLRFFNAASWEFCGKVKPDVPTHLASSSYLGKLLNSSFTSAVGVGESAVALFSGSGEASVYRYAKPSAARQVSSTTAPKLPLQQLVYYAPIAATEEVFLWARPAPAPAGSPTVPRRVLADGGGASAAAAAVGSWCLWSTEAIRIYAPGLGLRKSLVMASTCAAYQPRSRVLLTYDASTCEVAAFAAGDDWRGWARMYHEGALTCMAASDASDLCAGYCAATHAVTTFSCAWRAPQGGPSSLVLQKLGHVQLPARPGRPPVTQLLFSGDTAFALSADGLTEVEAGAEHAARAGAKDLLKARSAGANMLLLFHDHCAHYDPVSRELRPIPLVDVSGDGAPRVFERGGLVDIVFEPICDLIAVCDAQRIAVVRLQGNALIRVIDHDPRAGDRGSRSRSRSGRAGDGKEGGEVGDGVARAEALVAHRTIKSIDLRPAADHVVLTVLDSMGHMAEYTLSDRRIAFYATSPRTPREGRRPMAPVGNGAASARKGAVLSRTERAVRPPPKTTPPSTAAATTDPRRGAQARGRSRTPLQVKSATVAAPRAQTVSTREGRSARRRAVSAQGPSNRELEDRLEALTGFYEQQKLVAQQQQQQQQPARAPRRGSVPGEARERSPAGESAQRTARGASDDGAGEGQELLLVDGGDSPPPSRDQTARRGLTVAEGTPVRASGGSGGRAVTPTSGSVPGEADRVAAQATVGRTWESTSMAVSAITGPSTAAASTAAPGPGPEPCKSSPLRVGAVPPEVSVPPSEDEVVMAGSTSEGGSGPRRRQLLHVHTRSLRESLLQLQEALEEDDGGDEGEATGSTTDLDGELAELPPLLLAVAEALRQRSERRSSRGSATSAGAGGPAGASYAYLLSELQRIQQQNERLERQNRVIMDRLERTP